MNELSNALQSVIAQAAEQPDTGEVSRRKYRNSKAIGDRVLILVDTSGSMAETAGAKRKFDHAREAAVDIWPAISDRGCVCWTDLWCCNRQRRFSHCRHERHSFCEQLNR